VPAQTPTSLIVHTDGSCAPNPGRAAWAFVATDPTGQEVARQSHAIGRGTSQIAEIMGIIQALQWVQDQQSRATIKTDSRWCYETVRGVWRVKAPHLKPLVHHARKLAEATGSTLQWVPRNENSTADALAEAARLGVR
jgi:ribonuclease HI